jgi:glucokinase
MTAYDIGFDIGGTKCAVILGDDGGRILSRASFPTQATGGWHSALTRMCDEADALLDGRTARAVGVSCGGPLDQRRGLILSPPNLPGWDEVPVTDFIRNRMKVPAFLQNDANACALAEWRCGAAKGTRNAIFLTFGTGLGAGLILDGRLYEGGGGLAGEVGHIRLTEDGPMGYGKRGSFEGYCSGGGLNRLAALRMGCEITALELAERADAGDEAARGVYRESAQMLGRGLAILIDILNPDIIVIGSVFARAEKYFREDMERVLHQEALPVALSRCRVVASALGDRLGDVAALAVAANGAAK